MYLLRGTANAVRGVTLLKKPADGETAKYEALAGKI